MSAVITDFSGMSIDAGRLELLEPVGAGTHGSVYLAIDHHAPTSPGSGPARRAVKVVPKAGPSTHDTQHQRREFRIQASVSDVPGVHKLLEVHEDEGHFYLVSDYRDCDLFDLIAEGITFGHNDERIRSAFVQVLDAVHGCHRKKVYHRDLKPENILCTADGGEVFVADFGSATPTEQSHPGGHGTFCYLSPGQLHRCHVDSCTSMLTPTAERIGQQTTTVPYWSKYADVWALGLILFNLIAGGLLPWEQATPDDPGFKRFLEDEDYFESEFGISSGAADLLKRIFRMSPTARPSLAQIRSNVLLLNTFFAEFEEDSADTEADGEDVSDASSASDDALAAKRIEISCYERPLRLPTKRSYSEDEMCL